MIRAIRRYTSGSCARSHSSFGAVNPVSARLPVSEISRSSPIVRSISAHSAAVRWSFHRIAGRSTRSSASSATSPCIWPESPIPAGGPAAPRSSPSTRSLAVHQSSGSCSAHPGCGVESGYSTSARASTVPASSIATPLTAEVPTSSPTRHCPSLMRCSFSEVVQFALTAPIAALNATDQITA